MFATLELPRRVLFSPQLEVAECGSACLRMILRYHGRDVPLRELRQQCDVGRDGVSAKAVARAAQHHGLAVRGLKCDVDGLRRVALPAIAHWDFNHFVIVERVGRRKVTLVDPAVGRRAATHDEVLRSFTGVVLELTPAPGFVRQRSTARVWSAVRQQLRPYAGAGVTLFSLAFVLNVLSVAGPLLEQILLDHVLGQRRERWFSFILAASFAIGIAVPAIRYAQAVVLARLRCAIALRSIGEFVGRVLRLPLPFLARRSTGDLAHRVRSQEQLRELGVKLVDYSLGAVMIVCGTALLFVYDTTLGAIATFQALIRTAVVAWVESRARDASSSEQACASKERAVSTDALMSHELLRGLHATRHALATYARHLTGRLNAGLVARRNTQALQAGLTAFDGLAQSAILVLCGKAVLDGSMTMGALAAFVTVSRLLQAPMAGMASFFLEVTRARTIGPAIRDIVEQAPERWGDCSLEMTGAVELNELAFRYDGSQRDTLSGICLRIRPGETLAICGRSGSGKTTLGKLIARLGEPSRGAVTFDGVPALAFTERDFRRQVTVASQDVFVCEGSARFNMNLTYADASREAVKLALGRAGAWEVFTRLRHGIDADLGPGGCNISGGERQRLALARALVGKPRILVLDEATSCVDEATEHEIWRGLRALDCTKVVISHRPSTLRHADRVIVLEDGRIVESGCPSALLATNGALAKLFGLQAWQGAGEHV